MKLFRLKEDRHRLFTTKQVVDYFLKTNKRWFENTENLLYECHDDCRDVLLLYIESGDDRAYDVATIYVIGKWKNDWLGHVFEEVK